MMSALLVGLAGATVLLVVLWDAFETVILPRRVSRRFQLARLFYRATWAPWRAAARLFRPPQREGFLAVYGPLSLLMLLGLWAIGIVVAFGMLQSPRNNSSGCSRASKEAGWGCAAGQTSWIGWPNFA